MVGHPHKFQKHITDECSLCGGHFSDAPYLKTELESWSGRDAVLCGHCIDAMHEAIHEDAESDEVAQLRARAKELGIKNYHNMKPDNLAAKIAEVTQ